MGDLCGRPDSWPERHLTYTDRVRACGGYHNDHHERFWRNYGHPVAAPPGIPDAEFSVFHRPTFARLIRI